MSRFKKLVSRLPGSLEAYLLLKNLSRAARTRVRPQGDIARSGMAPAAACHYVSTVFAKIDAVLQQQGGWIGKRVLELGPGDSLGTGLLALAHGAASYQAIDRFAIRFDVASEREVVARLRRSLSPEQNARLDEIIELTDTGYGARDQRFQYQAHLPIEDAPGRLGESQFDVVFSNAVLEHVRDLEAALQALRRLLAPGGVMFHEVDLRSHQDYQRHPLEFLRYPAWFYGAMTSHTGAPNRLRFSAHRRLLEGLGFAELRFEIVECFAADLVEGYRSRLSPEFRLLAADDLEVAIFRVAASLPLAGP
jgi:SAM-dependent methyltransferase